MKALKINSLEEIHAVAREFLQLVGNKKVFALYGDMGVGKTTFIKAICEELGVQDSVNSPSFAIVNEYHSATDHIIYHFDFYRIEEEEEAYDFGYEDYFYSDAMCFIEWPEKIESLLPKETVVIHFSETANGTRILNIQ
ncbi:tRNA (adenosine(37)-N6)-threonylcarbamoyltransferase complex ATPase subunit type 1 TsaE [Ancylomarina longa]|uniref:tRNA threonylcarbamoyladenosine biosynthesis protein TsaE n=1 Tax=Ancylomarina longa TaxID=2487017 RepID=A0A434AUH3_9BACT|nr:tRNA (adenosine(37)-N6)-threonylcarbamoyltransferase complex ATPase subunit type 1 TsaE [Ancylomarina longa]RUT77993.1 tRNA (adenosine(37)-N6)-threonylcarbamoyltransferase complex ATPase subunit type 1 TsaE [Ancylomarina longa]